MKTKAKIKEIQGKVLREEQVVLKMSKAQAKLLHDALSCLTSQPGDDTLDVYSALNDVLYPF